MVNDFVLPKIDELGLKNWFQKDGAPIHTGRTNVNILKQAFSGCLISRFEDLHWPARSPDLSGPDFFLWGFFLSHGCGGP